LLAFGAEGGAAIQREGFLGPASSARISSTRLAVCQKNRYGEIVVPKTATSSWR
jgi:hypothetical protein